MDHQGNPILDELGREQHYKIIPDLSGIDSSPWPTMLSQDGQYFEPTEAEIRGLMQIRKRYNHIGIELMNGLWKGRPWNQLNYRLMQVMMDEYQS